MGLGYWMTERIVYDPSSGQLLTHNTWVRPPPLLREYTVPLMYKGKATEHVQGPLRSDAGCPYMVVKLYWTWVSIVTASVSSIMVCWAVRPR